MASVIAVKHVHAGPAVAQQALAVTGFDQAGKQAQVATEVEHARHARSQDCVFQRRLAIRILRGFAVDFPAGVGEELAVAVEISE